MEFYFGLAEIKEVEPHNNIIAICEELAQGDYSEDDAERILNILFSLTKTHPSLTDFVDFLQEVDFANRVDDCIGQKNSL